MTTPRLSVALVVYREQAYLRECVSAILEQSFQDVEFVAVDNASPDHGPEILDELAAKDPRLVVHRLGRSVSLGEARGVALERVSGDYLWFVETTDLLPADALGAVADRLDETSPDVLLVRHKRATALGRAGKGRQRPIIRQAERTRTFTLEERPAVADAAAVLWDKVFRRDFLRSLDVRFGAGRFGELRITYPALLAAERISALDRACYVRREPGNAANEPPVHGTAFDVFAHYDAVFEFADSEGVVPAARRRLVPLAMLRHCLAILDDLPDDRRREFFLRMSESYRRHARGDERIPDSRRQRIVVGLVEGARYGAFRAVRWAAGQQRGLGRRRESVRSRNKAISRARRRNALERHYRSQLREPIDPSLALFAAYWYRGYSCNPRAIYEKLRELAPGIRGVWIVDEEHAAAMPDGVEYVVAGTRDYWSVLARAKYCVNNVNFPNEMVKRAGTIHVQTHHGTPLKKMGLDRRGDPGSLSRQGFERLLRRCARWDYSISSNAFSTLVWERTYPVPYETLEVGYPRNDVLVNATGLDVERIRKDLGIDQGRHALLYAPTHREYLEGPPPAVDVGRLADELGDDYLVMSRTHYFYGSDRRVRELHRAGRLLDVSAHGSVEQLCLAADSLLTDYSSIMFDYAVLDRPVVIHAPDWDVYRTVRGTYFDLLAEPPGAVTTSDDEVVAAYRSGAVEDEDAAARRAAFRARFCALDDGKAAERVVRTVWLSEGRGPEPSPATSAVNDPLRRARIGE
jgi:CDP-glycerol glycerophosphotransferase